MMDEEEGWRCLQLKLISCRDLKAFNFFKKLSVYAVVFIFNQLKNCTLRWQRTLVDREGGGNPEWNHSMQFDLNPSDAATDHMFLKFKLRCGGVLFGKRSIGEVRVPLKDLIEEYNGSVRFLSYQVCTAGGKPNEVLNFSYELKGNNNNNKNKNITKNNEPAGSLSNHKCLLYPLLDDIRSPVLAVSAPTFHYQLPAFVVAHGVFHPCPSPLIPQPRPLWCATQTLAYNMVHGYGGTSYGQIN